MAETSSQSLVNEYRTGSDRAATEIHERYVARLISLARGHVAARLASRFDPEDIVQSAYRSFFVRARAGQFELNQAGDLWRLLAQITLNKLRSQVEWHSASRRDPRREQSSESAPPDLFREEPTPLEVVAAIDNLESLMRQLSPQMRFVLERRLQGDSNAEIASALGRTDRTVRRILAEIARKFALQEGLTSSLGAGPPRQVINDIDKPQLTPQDDLSWTDFLLKQHLGTGGMGRVYRALQKSTGQTVALKALRKDRQTDPAAVERFIREVELVRRLDHRAIVPVLGLGRYPAGGWFLVMEHVAGETFETLTARAPVPAERLATLIAQIARAVEHAHTRGVLHCDLTPRNILVDCSGSARVVDFGLGQLHDHRRPAENSLTAAGTPAFMAPEQFDPRYGTVGPHTDVYGLGAILYFGLSRRAPRQIDSNSDWNALFAGRVEPPQAQPGTLQCRLCEICMRCLNINPKLRISSAAEFARLLEAGCTSRLSNRRQQQPES